MEEQTIEAKLKGRLNCMKDVLNWIEKNPNKTLKDLEQEIKFNDKWFNRKI